MNDGRNRRREERLRYKWPVWFAEDFGKAIAQGLMVDVSSGGLAFTCKADADCPHHGQRLSVRFSIPRFEAGQESGSVSFTRTGHVRCVDELGGGIRRVAMQFDQPLTLKPAEQAGIEMIRGKIAD